MTTLHFLFQIAILRVGVHGPKDARLAVASHATLPSMLNNPLLCHAKYQPVPSLPRTFCDQPSHTYYSRSYRGLYTCKQLLLFRDSDMQSMISKVPLSPGEVLPQCHTTCGVWKPLFLHDPAYTDRKVVPHILYNTQRPLFPLSPPNRGRIRIV
ncbi:hypothetical protein DPMN_156455 [Dreissena polymorpha]|uniref:Uncharacterized protein n=1 Tax=Dreissena polymorpha TaxID=45954 RepID=A0A9D4FVP8_DREPO|nr:hypothetical protein DPMN_156455 [Dreissena polymorpha]